jgi:2,3-bisphosphoglycerate-dependent phosphoglycerate mutase
MGLTLAVCLAASTSGAEKGKQAAGKLILVRHGQSEWNLQNRFTGWTDVSLTRKGRAEARQAGKLIQGLNIDKAYTSDLRRAKDSLKIMLRTNHWQIPVQRHRALNERHYGRLQGLNKAATARRCGKKQVQKWRRSWNVAPPGGESIKMTAQRTIPYYERTIAKDLKQGKNVLVVAHSNSLRALVRKLDNISPRQVGTIKINTGVPMVYQMATDGSVLSKKVLH